MAQLTEQERIQLALEQAADGLAAFCTGIGRALEVFAERLRPVLDQLAQVEGSTKPGKNRLVVIGWLGVKRCYLNMTTEEAVERHLAYEARSGYDSIEELRERFDPSLVTEFEFDDQFGAYDAYTDEA